MMVARRTRGPGVRKPPREKTAGGVARWRRSDSPGHGLDQGQRGVSSPGPCRSRPARGDKWRDTGQEVKRWGCSLYPVILRKGYSN